MNERNKNETWTMCTYNRTTIRKIPSLFKHTNEEIFFKNTNTLQQFTKPKIANNTPVQEWNL